MARHFHAIQLVLLTGSVFAFNIFRVDTSLAQQNTSGNLPPVVVDSPRPRSSDATRVSQRPARSGGAKRAHRAAPMSTAANTPAAGAAGNVKPGQDPRGPINGYVADRSMTGTKTNTPLMETPQAISVIGAEQIRDQKPNNVAEALRYAPGVGAGTFGADTRNDWFKIRGFDAQDAGLFPRRIAAFDLRVRHLEIPALRHRTDRYPARPPPGCSMEAAGPEVSSTSSARLRRPNRSTISRPASIHSVTVIYRSTSAARCRAPAGQGSDLYYRLLGTIKNGETQTAFTSDDSYSIAPSLRYRPDLDTSFTVMASASKDQTRVQNFLPYVGTVVAAPFGRIPTHLFGSDPSVDTFRREQEMLGYQYEKNLTDNLTFRQNARFAHDDVKFQTLLGNGYLNGDPATAMLSRFNDFAADIANQANLDSQLEYRFATGPVLHKALVGVDLKHYQIDDLQAFDFATPRS